MVVVCSFDLLGIIKGFQPYDMYRILAVIAGFGFSASATAYSD